MKVELDKKALFALASDTRVDILRALQPLRRTVTQLAEAMNIDKAAVHRHLQKLVEGELVKRYEDHSFVYYGLSWKARDLLAPNENTKVIILLGSSIISGLGVGVLSLLSFIAQPSSGGQPGVTSREAPAPPLGPLAQSAPPLLWPLLALALSAVAVTCLVLTWRALRKPKQRERPQDGVVA